MTRNPIDIANRVSPRLSALLRSRVNNPACEQPVSLGRGAALKEDENDSLLPEIDALIEQSGADSLAEEFLHYE